MKNFFAFFEYLHNVFYGDHWFISWGIVIGIIILAIGLYIPDFLRSLKSAKLRKNK